MISNFSISHSVGVWIFQRNRLPRRYCMHDARFHEYKSISFVHISFCFSAHETVPADVVTQLDAYDIYIYRLIKH